MKKEKPVGIPYFITKRFQNLYGYVWNKLYSPQYLQSHLFNIKNSTERKERSKELKKLAAQVQWIVFLYLLRRFFLSGTHAAEEAVRIFAELKIEKFEIGGKEFFDGSESVNEGGILAERLMDAISDKKITKLILRATSTSDIIYHYRNRLYDEEKVYFFDQAQTKSELRTYFKGSKAKLNSFGSTVNQTVEAYVFAEVIRLYGTMGWNVKIKNPKVKKREVNLPQFNRQWIPLSEQL